MKGPFPGMDPYLESHWGDVHHNLITFAQGLLNERLPRDLRARVDERIVLESPEEAKAYLPDVRVVEQDSRRRGVPLPRPADVAIAEPLVVRYQEPETQSFIEIIQTKPERRVVTVVEIVSLSNKYAGQGREDYRKKQRDLRTAGISLVEIDLLRSGPHVLQLPLNEFPDSHKTPYKACVRRGGNSELEIYGLPLRERLPAMRIPLREIDADVPLDLQAVFDQAYRNAGYDDIDYAIPPVPPLEPADEAWADALLRAAGLRP